MSDMRRLINIVSKNDSNRVLTENKDERKSAVNDVTATAERMIERYRDSKYTAHERACDHAMSYDRDHPHQKFWIDVQNEIKRIKNKQKDVTEGSEGTLWRVERSEATGRYYVVKGYNKSRKIWKNKMGVGDFVDRKSAESKADELNKGVTEGTLKICSDKNPKLIGFTLKDLDRLSESAGSNFSKFDLALKKNLNLPKWTNTLELYGVYLRKLSESKTGKLLKEGHQSSVEKTLFKELSQRSIGSIDSAKVGDKVSLLHLTTLNIPGHKVVARLNGFLTPKEIVNIKNSGSFQQLEFSDGSRYPEKDGGDIFQQTQGWNMTKLFPTYESASKAYTLYALMGKKLSDELDFQTNIEQDVTEAKSTEEFIAQLKSLAQKPPRITNTRKVCGKKWQLQHHCKGPSKNQDKGVPLKFQTLNLKNSQIEEYTKKYFECYNIEQPHGKFISNIKRLSKINESAETADITPFINMLQRIDSKKKIKIGDKFAVLEFEIIFAYKEINGRGFVTPKEVEEIKLHSDGKINYIKFTDGDRYPRLTPAHYEGKPITYAAYFSNKNYAQQALSAITLAVPDEWDLDISDINQESMTEEKLITQHKPGKCTQCGGPSYDDEQLAEEKDACYRKVKSRYRVWPSAYACVPEETSKALTKTGWKSVDDLVISEEIMTFNMEKDLLEFKPILNLHRYTNAPTSVIKSGNTGFVFESTLNHKWVIKHPETKSDRVTKYEKINNMSLLTTSQLLESKTNKHLVVSAPFEEGQNIRKDKIFKYGDNWTKYILDISPEQRQTWLFSAIVYDGHQIRASRLTNNDKNINDLDWIYSGNYGKQSFGFRQKDIEHRDAFLLAAFLNGGTVTWKPHNIQKDIYSCYYVSNKRYKNLSNIRQIDSKITNVWCPETENNTWVMMQETEGSGIITITGNSGALVKCRRVGAKNWGNRSKK